MGGQNPFSHPIRSGIPFMQRLSSSGSYTSLHTRPQSRIPNKSAHNPRCHLRLRPFCDQFPHLYNGNIGLASLEPQELQVLFFFNLHFSSVFTNSVMVRRLYPLWTDEDTESPSLVNVKVGTEPKACKSNIPATAPELSPRPRCPQLVTWRM